MNNFEKKIKSVLVKTVPLPPDSTVDWEDVVRRSEVPQSSANEVRARRSGRSYRARRLVPVFVLAAAALAIGLIAPWGHGRSFTDSAVAERALVAIGSGPVLHVVLRNEDIHGSIIDLNSGRETPAYASTVEIWYDSERHFEHLKYVGEEAPLSNQTYEVLQTPTGIWDSHDAHPQKSGPFPALEGFLDGYRAALADGSARVTGTGTVDGRDVTWIEFKFDHRYLSAGFTYADTFVQRVAVDETSSLPIRLEGWALDSSNTKTFFSSSEIVSIEALPAGGGDFSKPGKIPFINYGVKPNQVTSIAPSGAAQALPGALWMGTSVSGLQLSSVSGAGLTWQGWDDPEFTKPLGSGIELRYGSGSPGQGVLWSGTSNVDKKPSGSFVVLQEAATNIGEEPPAGSIRVENLVDFFMGRLVKDGTHVCIVASSRELLLAAARALEPIQP